MADKKIIDLPVFSGGTKLKTGDILPIHNVSTVTTQKITGQQIANGVLDSTNPTNVDNLDNMLNKLDLGTRYAMTSSSSTTDSTTIKYLVVGEFSPDGTPTAAGMVLNIKFKIKILNDLGHWAVREYYAIFRQNIDSTFPYNPLAENPNLYGIDVATHSQTNGQTLIRMLDMSGTDPINSVDVYASNTQPGGSYSYFPSTRNVVFIVVNYNHPFGCDYTTMSITAEVF